MQIVKKVLLKYANKALNLDKDDENLNNDRVSFKQLIQYLPYLIQSNSTCKRFRM